MCRSPCVTPPIPPLIFDLHAPLPPQVSLGICVVVLVQIPFRGPIEMQGRPSLTGPAIVLQRMRCRATATLSQGTATVSPTFCPSECRCEGIKRGIRVCQSVRPGLCTKACVTSTTRMSHMVTASGYCRQVNQASLPSQRELVQYHHHSVRRKPDSLRKKFGRLQGFKRHGCYLGLSVRRKYQQSLMRPIFRYNSG